MNRLTNERSPYLRHAAHQGIDWYPWSDEAFETAKKEDRPVFLSSGAVWCHWCHVMAKECFENAEIAKLLNEHFICIKLDRDERPEIDRRYQNAVSAMGAGGGWPLSVFLTPDRQPFFGGTYFPPEDSLGRPGFKKVLIAVADYYKSKKEEIYEIGRKIIDSLKPEAAAIGEIQESLILRSAENILSQFDPQNVGFGLFPKFPMSGSIEFLIKRYFLTKNESIGYAVKKTLESMAKGGFHDQLGGGFHRYSVDEAWIIPHFEKMANDNAWLLRNYIDAYAVFGNIYFKEVAEGIIRFINEVLSCPKGGFYASQDADVTPDDEGGYFTWTDQDFKRVLNDEEYEILSHHLLSDRGSMHHDKSKKVLFVSMDVSEIARHLRMDELKVSEIIHSGKEKLLQERRKRKTPFIDRTFYTSLNGIMISSYLRAYRSLGHENIKDFAVRSLQKIINLHLIGKELFHAEGIKAVLDDYIYLIEALISAYEVTGDSSYLVQADELLEACIGKFLDPAEGGFFDTENEVLGLRLKGIEDIPHPAVNSLGIILLLKISAMTGKEEYRAYAETALKTFSEKAKDLGMHSAYFFCAMDAYFNILQLTMNTSPDSELSKAALKSYYPYESIWYGDDKGMIIPCLKNRCYDPVKNPAGLEDFLKNLLATVSL